MQPDSHVPTNHTRFFAARRRLLRLTTMERRISAWLFGWGFVVLAAWLLRWFEPEMMTWKMVAGAGGVHVILLWLLGIFNGWRHRARDVLLEMDEKIAEGE